MNDPSRAISILIDSEMRIGFLRKFARDLNLAAEAFIIKYKSEYKAWEGSRDLWEYASIGPLISKGAAKRARVGTQKESMLRYARWKCSGVSHGGQLDE